ncbi:MAG TPA: hypothetical protein VFQ53_32905 [Kofleriaceae bacterium]|nr:hypothetical protein [Kofleriaceae bacterium]
MRSHVLAMLAVLVGGAASASADDAKPDDATPADKPSGDGIARGTDKGTIGVGIVIGEPVGVCAKLYLADDQAIQGAVGSAFIGGGLQVHADYVWHPYILQKRDSFVLATYLGPGVRVIQYSEGRDASYVALGLRAVGGLLFDFDNPLDAFIEVAGVFEYGFADGKGAGLALNAGAGVRYYF